MLEWMERKSRFPPLLLLRRYIKIVARYCQAQAEMDAPLDRWDTPRGRPFDVRRLPLEFPPLDALTLWSNPARPKSARGQHIRGLQRHPVNRCNDRSDILRWIRSSAVRGG